MKKIFLAIIAMGVTVAVAAQERQVSLQKGDSVQLNREYTTYLTGETIPSWVYDMPLTVLQVGNKTYPNGVLLKEVLSWVSMEAVGASVKEPLVEEPQPLPQPVPVARPLPQPVKPVAEPEPSVKAEPAAKAEPIADPEPVAEPAPAAEPALAEVTRNQNRFGIGLRAGGANFMPKVSNYLPMESGRSQMGFVAALDLEYAWLHQLESNPNVSLGIRTGLSVAFAQSSMRMDALADSYFVTDNEQPANNILYTVSAQQVEERLSQVMAEVPVLFALRGSKGFVFATGPKVNLPVMGRYQIHYKNPSIIAYYAELGVVEPNEVVTGLLSEQAPQADTKLRTPKINLLWNIEIGYEWTLKNGNGLALTAFADAPIYSSYQEGDFSTHFIDVSAPKAGGPDIKSYAIMNSYGRSFGLLDGGVKLTYNFCFRGKK